MRLSAVLGPLLDAKADHELIRAMVLAHEAAQADALEQRRESDRKRQAAKAERDRNGDNSRDSRERGDAVSSHASATHVEDKTSNSEIQTEESKGRGKRKAASRLPANAPLTDECLAIAVEVGLSPAQAAVEWATMVDWSLSSPSGAKLDWIPTWRNWCRRWLKDNPPRQQTGPPRRGNAVMDRLNELEDRGHNDFHPQPSQTPLRLVSAAGSR